MDLTVLW